MVVWNSVVIAYGYSMDQGSCWPYLYDHIALWVGVLNLWLVDSSHMLIGSSWMNMMEHSTHDRGYSTCIDYGHAQLACR